jgi:protein-S-isoprenylcysteine O-methyltransferase Ste14
MGASPSAMSSNVITLCWGLFALVWLAGALYGARRRSVVRRAPGPRLLALVVVVTVWLLFRLVPDRDWRWATVSWPPLRTVGAAVLLGSTAFALWARVVLGVWWSSTAVVKQGHQLRTNGPYAITRHPIYTGILGMLLGTTLLEGIGGWGVIFLLALAVVEGRIVTEERLLTETFGAEYRRYRAEVPRLIPGLRQGRRAGA